MKKFLLALVAWLAFAAPTLAANVNIDGLPAASSVTGTDLFECEQSGTNRKCTATQLQAFSATGYFPGYIVGNWYVPYGQSVYSTGNVAVANSARFIPGYVPQTATINALGFRVNTLGAGNCQGAVYANNPTTMRPTGSQLAATASISTGSAGNFNAAVSVQLTAGLYWFATNCDNTTVILESVAGGNAAAIIGSATQNLSLQLATGFAGTTTPLTFGTWGDVTSATWTDTPGSLPMLQFKIGSVP